MFRVRDIMTAIVVISVSLSLMQSASCAESGFFGKLWDKIQSAAPKPKAVDITKTAVMGVRGAETTETAIRPYWDHDLSEDRRFQEELKTFKQASKECQHGKARKGADELTVLADNSPYAIIQANSLLALAACYHQLKKQHLADKRLRLFIKKFPNHPSAKDVKHYLGSHHHHK